MKRSLLLVVTMVLVLPSAESQARKRSVRIGRSRCCIPNHGYSSSLAGPSVMVESRAAVSLTGNLGHEVIRRQKVYSRSPDGGTTMTETWEESARPVRRSTPSTRKVFVIPTATAGRIQMTAPAATLYDSGALLFSCRLNYLQVDGTTIDLSSRAKFASTPSAPCVIQIEALGDPTEIEPAEVTETNEATKPAVPVLFTIKREVRVQASDSGTLFRLTERDKDRLGRHFDEISQLRIYVQSRRDR